MYRSTSMNRHPSDPSLNVVCVCVCVCVVIPFILDVRLVAGVTQKECHTGFLHLLSREGFSRPFPSLIVKSNPVNPRSNRSRHVGHDTYIFVFLYFCEEKSQFVWLHRDSNSRPNVRRFRGYQLNHLGNRIQIICTSFLHHNCYL